MFIRWCFFSHLVLRCTNRHQNKPISICLCSRDGSFKQAPQQTYLQLFMFMGWCFYSHLVLRCTNRQQIKPMFQLFMFIRWCLFSHLVLRCTNRHQNKPIFICLCSRDGAFKQAQQQTYLQFFMFMGWCFYSHLVLWCTNGHQNRPIFSCLSLWHGAFTRTLPFDVQTGTKSNQFLVVYVYGVVLLLASCTQMYKKAPKQTYLYLFMFTGWCFDLHLVLWCTNRHQNKPIFSCLCLRGGAFTRILYFDVQTSTKTNLSLVVYVYGMVLLLASSTSMYKQAPKQTYLAGV